MPFAPSPAGATAARSSRIERRSVVEAVVQPGLGGPDRDVEDVRCLGERQVEVVVQDHHGALVDRQRAEARAPCGRVRAPRTARSGRIAVSGSGSHGQLHQGAPPLLLRELVAGAHGQAVEPGLPRVGVTQGVHVLPGQDERVLHGVLGAVAVAQDEGGDGIQPGDRSSRQVGERLEVTRPRSFHELSLHVATDVLRPIWPLSPTMGPEDVRSVLWEGETVTRPAGGTRPTPRGGGPRASPRP